MKGQFENIDKEEKPGGGTNEFFFGEADGQEIDVGKGTGQVTYHGTKSSSQAHNYGKSLVVWNLLFRKPFHA